MLPGVKAALANVRAHRTVKVFLAFDITLSDHFVLSSLLLSTVTTTTAQNELVVSLATTIGL